MRTYMLLLCLLFVPNALAEKTFVIQSSNLTELYGDSIIRELKLLRPEDNLRALFLRDVNRDKFSLSKVIMALELNERTEAYDNVVVLGNDLSYLARPDSTYLVIPLLVTSGTGIIGPASPINVIQGIKLARMYTNASGNVYVLSDLSAFSKFRLRQFEEAESEHYDINITPITVRTTTGLRSSILSLNKLESGFIVNNLFFLRDDDVLSDIYMDTTDKIIAEKNKVHIEVGILRDGLPTAVGFGILAKDIALHVDTVIGSGESITPPYSTGVNLDRIAELDINNYVLGNDNGIIYITVDDL